MSFGFTITKKEKAYLREIAKKYIEYANLPVMEERKRLWYEHNSLISSRPIIVMEHSLFEEEILPASRCDSKSAKDIERYLMSAIRNFELINDDKVISPYFEVFWKIDLHLFGMDINRIYAEDAHGKKLGYKEEHPIVDLKKDFHKLKPSAYRVDREYTYAWKNYVEEVIGDILPVKIKNNSLFWHIAPSQRIVELMGLEAMMYSMVDYPDEMHTLYQFVKDDIKTYISWQEKEKLLILNNENDFTGAGSYGFTTELPSEGLKETGTITAKDLWGNMNSQETVGVSPEMFGAFIFPSYYDLAGKFGLVYFGCCEPVHPIWEDYISKLPGLRKVSVSPWCDEEFMGNALKGGKVIYSRKPSPNFVGVDGMFDENAFARHIEKTLKAARGCTLEFIFRDIYTLSGDISKPGKAVKIAREMVENIW